MNRLAIAAFVAAVVLYFLSLYIYMPILPAFVAGRSLHLADVGVVLSMYGLWTAILRMPTGITADLTGRNRPFLVAGTLLGAAGAGLMVAGGSLGTLLAGRALTGAAAAAWVPMMVVFAAYFPPRQAIFAASFLSLASSLGQIMGTLTTGLVESKAGPTGPFIVAIAASIAAAAIFAFVRLPPKKTERSDTLSPSSILAVFRRRDVLVPALVNALCQFAVWALTFSFMPLLAHRMGANAGQAGLIMTLNIGSNLAANLFATLRADTGHRRLMLYGSFGTFALGAILAALGPNLGYLYTSTILMGLANGLLFPILVGLSIQYVDGSRRATAMGIHQSVYAIGMFTGPWAAGLIADALGIRPMFAIMAAISFVGPGALILLYSPPRVPSRT
ncbi:MAG: MFS transporter [Treponema sp.]|nr:MFS transporter [Treponema sp.]